MGGLGSGVQSQPGTCPQAGLQWESSGVTDTDHLSQAVPLPRSAALAQYSVFSSPDTQREQPKKSPLPLICHVLAPCVLELGPSSHRAQNLLCSPLCSCISAFHRCNEQQDESSCLPSLGISVLVYFTVPCGLVFLCSCLIS